MSSQINNSDPDNNPNVRDDSAKQLKEFLEKNSGQSDDSFDKEASEGFAILGSEQEAIEMKAELDEKISSKFFLDSKKSANETEYNQLPNSKKYWLAAAGFLLVIGLSIYFISNSPPREKNLAVSEKSTSAEQLLTTDSSAPVFNVASGELKNQNPEKKPGKQNEAKKNVASEKNDNSDKHSKVTHEAPGSEMVSGASQAAEVASAPAVLAESYDVKTEAQQMEESDKKASKQLEKEISTQRTMSAKSTQNKKASGSPSNDAAGYSAAKMADTDESASPKKSSSDIFYPGGEDALMRSLKKKLGKKEFNQNFDALLFINKNGKVERVEFTKTFELSSEQQKEVAEILKTLGNFEFYSAPAGSGFTEYKVYYRK